MNGLRIDHKTLRRFVNQLLCASGVDAREAGIVATIFVWFDLIGRDTQGVQRLPVYLQRLGYGLITSPCNPEFIRKSETIYVLNGNNGLGHYLGHIAMSKALEVADRYGVGVVGVHHSNHFGAAAYYVQLAAQNSNIGLAFSNSVPHVAPHGGVSAALGTNPLAFGAPTRNGQSVLVDLSTAASAGSVVRKAAEEHREIPAGTIIDENGNALVDPKRAARWTLLPFGGAKGYCLGLMVEVLSGVLTGSSISHEIASLHRDFEKESNVGHLFVALDISRFMSLGCYYDRIERLSGFIKGSRRQKDIDEILIPGEIRWRNYEKQLKDGISLDSRAVESLITLAKELNVPTPW